MSHERDRDHDERWRRLARVLRPAWELRPLTLDEAAAAFELAPIENLAPEVIGRLVHRLRRALDEGASGELAVRLGLLYAFDTFRGPSHHRCASEMVCQLSDFVTDVDSLSVNTDGITQGESPRFDWPDRRDAWSQLASIEVLRLEPGDPIARVAMDHGTSAMHAYSAYSERDLSVDHLEYGRLDESLVERDDRLRGYLNN